MTRPQRSTGRRIDHPLRLVGPLLCGLLTASAACRPTEDEAPPADAAPTEGIYGRVAPAVQGLPSVVLLASPESSPPATAEPPTIDQIGLQFAPRVLIVPLGEPIVFTNSESIAHNIVVRPSEGGEDLLNADTPPGGRVPLVIEEPGAYDVTCDIHPGMTAMLFATDAAYGTVAEVDGSFRLTDVPPGRYTLTVWSLDERARAEQPAEVVAGRAVEVNIVPNGA